LCASEYSSLLNRTGITATAPRASAVGPKAEASFASPKALHSQTSSLQN